MTNPYITALGAIAAFGILIGVIAAVADFGYNSNPLLQAAVSQGAGGLGVLALVGGLVASAVTWKPTIPEDPKA